MLRQPGTSPLRASQVLAASLMSALVVIGVALSSVFAGRHHQGSIPIWPFLVLVAEAAVAAVAIQLIGYRVPPLPSGLAADEARSRGLLAFQQSMILRFALAESVALVAIVLSFAVRAATVTPYLLGAAISLVLMGLHVWPSERVIARVQENLDRDGGRSELATALRGG